MTKDQHEYMTMEHEHVLNGIGDQKGLIEKLENLWEWFQASRGKNSVIMFVKDVLISGGIIAVLLSYWVFK